jgi:hypothetical protein
MSVLFDEDPEERRQADDFVEREDSSRDGDPAVQNGVHNPLSDFGLLLVQSIVVWMILVIIILTWIRMSNAGYKTSTVRNFGCDLLFQNYFLS